MNKPFSLLGFVLTLAFGLSLSASALGLSQCPVVDEESCSQRPPSQKKDWNDGWNKRPVDGKGGPHKGQCQRERFISDLTAYLTREAGLTPDETQKFFPVFFEMRQKQHAMERQKAKALRLAADRNQSESECARVLDQIDRFNKKALRIETSYMERLEKLIGARKLVKVLRADRQFGRKMFHERRGGRVVKAARLVDAHRAKAH